MPSYHQYQGYRLDLSAIEDPTVAERIAAQVERIASEDQGGADWLRERLGELSQISSVVSVDLLAFERGYGCWTLWSLAQGQVRDRWVRFRLQGETSILEMNDEWMMPEIELRSPAALAEVEAALRPYVDSFDDLVEGEQSFAFPFEWRSDAELSAGLDVLRPYFGHVPRLALTTVLRPAFGLRLVRLSDLARSTDLAVLEPWLDEPGPRAALLRLWTEGTEVIRPRTA